MGVTSIFAAVSLDGFIAKDDDTIGPLFDWYGNGDVATTFSDESRVFHTTRATADFLESYAPPIAAGVMGRRLFDITNGWNGVPANGEHAFVVTHRLRPTGSTPTPRRSPSSPTSGAPSSRPAPTPVTATSRSPPVRSAARHSARG